jgi:23S rRNA (uracil1939-C5)-methyltransferase
MKPVEKGQIIDIKILDLTHTGQGIGKVENFPVFVNNTLPGEEAEVQITDIKKNFALARLLRIIKQVDDRVIPQCPIYHQCGGCNIQHTSYVKQLFNKTKLVKENLKRIGNIDMDVKSCIGMDDPWKYRNKTQVPFGMIHDQIVAGFYQEGTHDIIDMDGCAIQDQTTDDIINYMKILVKQYHLSTYDEISHRGILRHVIVRYGYTTREYMVTLVVTTTNIPHLNDLINDLTNKFPQIKSIVLNVNDRRTNTILGRDTEVVYGEAYIYDYIGDVKFAISSKSFFQVNPIQTKKLYDVVLDYADLKGNEVLIDAYCGIGTIGLYLSKQAKAIYGVEIVKEAIDDAKMNAKINHFDNAHYEVGKAEEVIKEWQKKGINADVIVIDPPRKGCDINLLNTIIEMQIPKVVYVSCDPSTLARDLKILNENNYKILEVQPVDMFPHTMHVESVVLLVRK